MQQIGTKNFLVRKSSERFSTGLEKFYVVEICAKNLFREINDLYEYVDYFKKVDAA